MINSKETKRVSLQTPSFFSAGMAGDCSVCGEDNENMGYGVKEAAA